MLSDILGFAANTLDAPASIIRGLIAGEPGRAFGGVFDPSQRVSGREMLGFGENTDEWDTGDFAGFGAELLTDPLNLLGGGLLGKALANAGKANKAFDAAQVARQGAEGVNAARQAALTGGYTGVADIPQAYLRTSADALDFAPVRSAAAEGLAPELFHQVDANPFKLAATYGTDPLRAGPEYELATGSFADLLKQHWGFPEIGQSGRGFMKTLGSHGVNPKQALEELGFNAYQGANKMRPFSASQVSPFFEALPELPEQGDVLSRLLMGMGGLGGYNALARDQ